MHNIRRDTSDNKIITEEEKDRMVRANTEAIRRERTTVTYETLHTILMVTTKQKSRAETQNIFLKKGNGGGKNQRKLPD